MTERCEGRVAAAARDANGRACAPLSTHSPTRLVVSLALSLFAAATAHAETDSLLSIPIEIEHRALGEYLARALPSPLVSAERVITCLDAVIRLRCTLDQHVERVGPIVSAPGETPGTLTLSGRFDGRATLRGRGDLARHLRESASGTAALTLTVAPEITSDWRLQTSLTYRIDWPEPPKAMLLDRFPVTFESHATAALDDFVESFAAEARRGFDLTARIEPLWTALQRPVPLSLPNGPALTLAFRPNAVALAPLAIGTESISTRLSVRGRWRLDDAANESGTRAAPVPLPPLSAEPPPAGVAIALPVVLELGSLATLANDALPRLLEIDGTPDVVLEIRALALEETATNALSIELDTTVEVPALGLGPIEATIDIDGTPRWNADTEVLSLANPAVRVDGRGVARWALEALLSRPSARAHLAAAAELPLGGPIDDAERALNAALTRPLANGVHARAALAVTVPTLALDGGLRLTLEASGDVELSVYAPE